MYIAAISNPLQYSESRQPLDAVTSYLTKQILENDIDKVRQKNVKPKSQIYYATPAFQNITKADLIGGKTNLGAFALCNSHHALAQAVSLTFSNNQTLNKYGIKSAAKIFSDKPNYHDKQPIVTLISDWISAMINAHVDVAKDPYINRLNIRKATLNAANLLLRTGKGESTFYFLAQDILIDFANEFDSYSGYYGVELYGDTPKSAAMRNVIEKYQSVYERLSGEQYNIYSDLDESVASKMFDINWLRKVMVKPSDNASDAVKANWYKNQLDIMKAFRELEPAARSLSKLTNLSQIDTKKFGNNFALQQNFLMKLATFMREDKMFENKGAVIKNTFLRKKLLDGLLRPRKFLNKTMLRLTNIFETYRNNIYNLTGQNEFSSDGYVNAITRMMEASYKVKFIADYAKSQDIDVAGLLYGNNSIARRLIALKKDIKAGKYPELLNSDGTFSNSLLDSIDTMSKVNSLDFVLPDFLQLNVNKSEDHNIDNHIIRAWTELLDSEHKEVREFARDLAVFAMYTSGDAFGKNNIFKYVPESFRESSGYYDNIRKLESNPEELIKYLNKDEIIRSLWWNDDVVPAISVFKDDLDENNVPIKVMVDHIPTPNPLLIDDKIITVPGLLINPSVDYFGNNDGSQPIFQPYVKVNLGARNDPRTTMLYKYIGFTKDENDKTIPYYKLVNKLGLNYKGKTFIEPMGGSNPKSMMGVNSGYFMFDYRALGITLVTDFIKDSEKLKTDDFTYLNKVFGETDNESVKNQPTAVSTTDDDITKYLAPGEEATEIVRETINLAKKGLKVTNDLGEFFTKEEKELIIKATANKPLFVKSASRRTDPAFFTEDLINQLKENAKLPFGHPDRFYVMEIWSKHDGLPMTDLIDACIQYRVAPVVSFSISTLGGSSVEPGVMNYDDLLNAIEKLIKDGKLNPATMTVRIDPLLPGITKLEDIEKVVNRASSMGVTKFVSSVMQSYGFTENTSRPRGIVPALTTAIGYNWDKYYGRDANGNVAFRPKKEYAETFGNHLKELIKKYGVRIESCASNNLGLPESACLDPLAIEKVTGVTVNKDLKDKTRTQCQCYGAHGDMLKYSDVCRSCCAYCYAAQQISGVGYKYYDEAGNLIDSALTRTSRVNAAETEQSEYISHSGGANGSDSYWGKIGEEYGVKSNHYWYKNPTPKGNVEISEADAIEGQQKVTIAARQMGRIAPTHQVRDERLIRNWSQVKYADAIFAVTTLLKEGDEMNYGKKALIVQGKGGTGYAMQMAINEGKPVYVYDQIRKKWYSNINGKWDVTVAPTLTHNFAGIGTRDLNEDGEKAIESVYEKTFQPALRDITDKNAVEFDDFVKENSQWIDGRLAKQIKQEVSEAEKKSKKLTYTFSDGTEVATPFELNDQQKQALAEIEAFYNSDETSFTLQGYAGTGKTTIMKIFDEYLKKHYDKPLYIAPTHRANAVTKANNPGVETSTLHSFLGLQPQFDLTKDEFDLKDVKFDGGDSVRILNRFLIIDESSMIEDKLYEFLVQTIKSGGNKVLFLGDPAQLRPVNATDISSVFKQSAKVELTKVERTGDNAILKEATRLRNGESLSYEIDINDKGEGVIYTNDQSDVRTYITNVINSEEYTDNYSYFKILTATNDNIPIYNDFVRVLRFGKNAPQLVKGELLMGYNNEIRTGNIKQPYNLINSGDYVVKNDPVKTTKKIPETDIVLEGYNVRLKDAIGNSAEFEAFIVDNNTPNKVLRAISIVIDNLWNRYKEFKAARNNRAAALIIQRINDIQNSFLTMKPIIDELSGAVKRAKSLDYGYTHTIHKSQGGTYNKVLVLGGSINKFQDPQERQQLSYVAMTRAKEQVMWTVPKEDNIVITTKQQPAISTNSEQTNNANNEFENKNEYPTDEMNHCKK